MKIEETILKNGAKIIAAKIPNARSVAIHFGFRTGSRSETTENLGISHFLEHMLFKGSAKRPTAEELAQTIDAMGAEYNAYTAKEITLYHLKTTKENFKLALDVIGDMATRPVLSPQEAEKEKGTIIQEIHRTNDNPDLFIFHLLEENAFGDTPLGREILGTKESVSKLDGAKIKEYFNQFYSGQNLVIGLAGDIPEDYLKQVTKYAEILPKGEKVSWDKAAKRSKRVSVLDKDINQSQVGIAIPSYSLFDPKHYVMEIIATVLGGYMSSRLFTEIREKRGWAYRIGSYSETFVDTGYLGIFGGIKKDKVIEALALIKKEVTELGQTITEEELNRAKSHLKGSFGLRFENTDFIAEFIVSHALLLNRFETPDQFIEKIEAVGIEQFKNVANEVLKVENIYLSAIGPFKSDKEFDKILY